MKTFRFVPPLILLSILALSFALWAGLLRIGWALPAFNSLAGAHGPLMVCGFLGTLIPLERAVAIRQKWMFAAPALAASGWISLLAAPTLGAVWFTLGSWVTVAILTVMVKREPQIHTITMLVGTLAWAVGNLLWMSGRPVFQIVPLWIAFLTLTIGGERLELSRVLRPAPWQIHLFTLAAAALLAGALLSLVDSNLGARLSGVGLVGLA